MGRNLDDSEQEKSDLSINLNYYVVLCSIYTRRMTYFQGYKIINVEYFADFYRTSKVFTHKIERLSSPTTCLLHMFIIKLFLRFYIIENNFILPYLNISNFSWLDVFISLYIHYSTVLMSMGVFVRIYIIIIT